MILRKMNLRLNDMNLPKFHLAKVKEMQNGIVRVKGNANSLNLFRMEGGFAGEVLVGSVSYTHLTLPTILLV